MEKASPEVIKANLRKAREEKRERERLAKFRAERAKSAKPLVHNPFAGFIK